MHIANLCLTKNNNSFEQAAELRSRPDVVLSTPGRLIDHLRNTVSFDIEDVEILILDEADRLLELGFMAELKELLHYAPKVPFFI